MAGFDSQSKLIDNAFLHVYLAAYAHGNDHQFPRFSGSNSRSLRGPSTTPPRQYSYLARLHVKDKFPGRGQVRLSPGSSPVYHTARTEYADRVQDWLDSDSGTEKDFPDAPTPAEIELLAIQMANGGN